MNRKRMFAVAVRSGRTALAVATLGALSCIAPGGDGGAYATGGKGEFPTGDNEQRESVSAAEAVELLAAWGWVELCAGIPDACDLEGDATVDEPGAKENLASLFLTLLAADAGFVEITDRQIALKAPTDGDAESGPEAVIDGTPTSGDDAILAALTDGTFLLVGVPDPSGLEPVSGPATIGFTPIAFTPDHAAEPVATVTREHLSFDLEWEDTFITVEMLVRRLVSGDTTLTLVAPEEVSIRFARYKPPDLGKIRNTVFRSNGGANRATRLEYLRGARHIAREPPAGPKTNAKGHLNPGWNRDGHTGKAAAERLLRDYQAHPRGPTGNWGRDREAAGGIGVVQKLLQKRSGQ